MATLPLTFTLAENQNYIDAYSGLILPALTKRTYTGDKMLKIVAGDTFNSAVVLRHGWNGAAYDFSAASSVLVSIVSKNYSQIYTGEVPQLSTAIGADWANGILKIELGNTITNQIADFVYGSANGWLEIQITIDDQVFTWHIPCVLYSTGIITEIPPTPILEPSTLDRWFMFSNMELSGGDYTVRNTLTQWASVAGTKYKNSGKRCFEVYNSVDANLLIVGLGTALTNTGNFLGASGNNVGNCVGVWVNNATARYIYQNSTATLTLPQCLQDQAAMVAVDFDAGKAWFGINNVWSGNPVSGTGQAFTFTPNARLFPMASMYGNAQYATFAFNSADFINTLPSGFIGWDE